MKLIILKLILIILSFFNNIDNIIICSTLPVITRLLLDNRSIKLHISNLILKKKLYNYIINNKNFKKNNIIIYVYKNNIILIGKCKNIKNLIKIEKFIISKIDKNRYIIINNLFCKNFKK